MATTKNKKPKIKAEFGLFKSEFGHLEYGIVTSQKDVDNLLAIHLNRTDPIFLQQAVFQGITAELRQRGFKI